MLSHPLAKGKNKGMDTCYSATYMSQIRDQQRFTIGSGSWLAWANGAAAHYVAVHCPRWQTIGSTVQLADTPSPQSATLGLHPIAVATTLLICALIHACKVDE